MRDYIGRALDLEECAKTTESQTAQRAMLAAAAMLRDVASDPLYVKSQQFLSDVSTAAGLLFYGKKDKRLAERLSEAITIMRTRGLADHWSDCATSNGPAYPVGPCDCGAVPPENIAKAMQTKMLGPGHMTDAERLEAARRFRGD